ncbi:hypothetical protein [uncultured Albimonas sp.]|uniref:hypothetical protein n=1 Tax=uncultured Albimonas sp. TaxID=1331701 RepID=UPI0030EEDEBF|tara:strand:+ start:7016 stop:7441 length:426 start_codon:yes stop_codon:yes gene_type:complete
MRQALPLVAAAAAVLTALAGCAANFGEDALEAGSVEHRVSRLPPGLALACLREDLDRGPVPPSRESRGEGERVLVGVLAMDPRVWLYRVTVSPAPGGGARIEAEAADPGYPMSDWWQGELHLFTQERIAARLARAAAACAG